jgi:hypothetical protein
LSLIHPKIKKPQGLQELRTGIGYSELQTIALTHAALHANIFVPQKPFGQAAQR